MSMPPYNQRERLRSSMKIGEHGKMLDVNSSDWRKVGRRLGIAGDRAVGWVDELRSELPGAFERAIAIIAPDMQDEAHHLAERIVEHVAGTWRPSISR
jgi:serine/threonine-protein kinase HipA